MIKLKQTISAKLLSAALILLFATSIYAEEIDWQKYCIDGIELTGNSDVRYQGGAPRVKATAVGKSAEEMAGIVDADGPGRTVVVWKKARK